MLRFAILELLHRKALSGYELKRRFEGSIVFFWRANHSQIYLELKRMEKEGLVAGSRVAQDWRPTKKVYAITPKGQAELERWLAEKPKLQTVKDEMTLKCFAFSLIPPEEADRQLLHHRKLHEGRLQVYLETKRQLEEKHGDLLETRDPILFWNALCLYQVIDYERMYIDWCEWAQARHRIFREGEQQQTPSLDAGEETLWMAGRENHSTKL
jgi:DNA-binding PadR family transcriptional regulator